MCRVLRCRLAAAPGSKVVLVHAFEPLVELEHPPTPGSTADLAARREQHKRALATVWSAPLSAAGVAHTVQLSEDTPIEALLAAAAEHKADLVVIGSHGSPGWQDRIFGRVANALPPRLGGPVVIVPVRPAA